MGLLTIVEQNKARACDRLPGDIRARALISQDVRTLDTIYRLRKAAASRWSPTIRLPVTDAIAPSPLRIDLPCCDLKRRTLIPGQKKNPNTSSPERSAGWDSAKDFEVSRYRQNAVRIATLQAIKNATSVHEEMHSRKLGRVAL